SWVRLQVVFLVSTKVNLLLKNKNVHIKRNWTGWIWNLDICRCRLTLISFIMLLSMYDLEVGNYRLNYQIGFGYLEAYFTTNYRLQVWERKQYLSIVN